MSDYISRAAVREMLEKAHTVSDGEYCGYCTEDVDIDAIPAADVRPVVRGEWMIVEKPLTKCKIMICSVCGKRETKGPGWEKSWGTPPFCELCGADMRGGGKQDACD